MVNTCINCGIICAGCKGNCSRCTVGTRVAVDSIVTTGILRTEYIVVRQISIADCIGSGFQPGETVAAVICCRSMGNFIAVSIINGHGNAADTGFTRILDTVSINVMPDKVTKRGRLVNTRIPACIIFIGIKMGSRCQTSWNINVTIESIISSLILISKYMVRRKIGKEY